MHKFKKGDIVLIVTKYYLSTYMKIAIVTEDQISPEYLVDARCKWDTKVLSYTRNEVVKLSKAQEYLYAD